MKMQWNVYVEDINSKKIKEFNIFKHNKFYEGVKNILRICKTKEEFSKSLKKEIMYYYWAKAEWEVIITSWPPHLSVNAFNEMQEDVKNYEEQYGHAPYTIPLKLNIGVKVDVYDQIMLNYDVFVDYIWNFKESVDE